MVKLVNMQKYKKNKFKTSHKIIFTLLSLVGMLGLTFGVSVFLLLGNESSTKADTTKFEVNEVNKVAENKAAVSIAQINFKPEKTSIDLAVQAEPVKPHEITDQVSYTVQEGDSLSAIASQFQVSMASIMQQNNLASTEAINIGQVLVFSRSYIVKEETPIVTEEIEQTIDVPKSQDVSVNNGNKVAAGGLSEEDRTYVLTQLQTRTGVEASQWDYIISRESGWIPTIKNSIGYYGLFQLAPGYLGYDGDVQSQIEGAIYLFNHGGMAHWAL